VYQLPPARLTHACASPGGPAGTWIALTEEWAGEDIMDTNRHQPMDRDPAEGPRVDGDREPESRRRIEPEEPDGRASRGTSPVKGTEAGWTPPRDESRDATGNAHRPRRRTL
jgi:hypothetical protein